MQAIKNQNSQFSPDFYFTFFLQAAHVLIDRGGRAKLSGLRYSCSLYDSVVEASCSASVGCMTQDRYDYPLYVSLKHLNWMSPEILQQVSESSKHHVNF